MINIGSHYNMWTAKEYSDPSSQLCAERPTAPDHDRRTSLLNFPPLLDSMSGVYRKGPAIPLHFEAGVTSSVIGCHSPFTMGTVREERPQGSGLLRAGA